MSFSTSWLYPPPSALRVVVDKHGLNQGRAVRERLQARVRPAVGAGEKYEYLPGPASEHAAARGLGVGVSEARGG